MRKLFPRRHSPCSLLPSSAIQRIYQAASSTCPPTGTPPLSAWLLSQVKQERPSSSSSSSSSKHAQPKRTCGSGLPFRFETGTALFAKRTPRPFPPPFLSPPSGSFSDALSTHHQSRDRRGAYVNGKLIRGRTNGDDAVFASDCFICANDGVGAWSTRPRGHSGLWARLILHFWAEAICESATLGVEKPDPVGWLQQAFEQTKQATSPPNDWQGTTTVAGAQIFYREGLNDNGTPSPVPVVYVTNLGDSQVMVIRPATGEMVFKTTEQWHWFDCPRQLGTNSPDTPLQNAKLDVVDIQEGDVVLAMSDGVIDNLWPHEIVQSVCDSVKKWEQGHSSRYTPTGDEDTALEHDGDRTGGANGGMQLVAEDLMEAARVIAVDPFAESPYMEHAIEEGLPSEGGKLDDISVVAALCRRNATM